MFDAMRIGIVINRGMRGDGERPSPREILGWPTANAAKALARQDLGSLEPGKKADLSVVRLDRPHLTPVLDVVSSLVHYAQASDVESVMVGGEWIMRDGAVLTMDESAVVQEAQDATIDAWGRLREGWPGTEIPESFRELVT